MPTKDRVISSDGHVYEPPDLWTTRLGKEFRAKAPKIIAKHDGDWWYCQGQRLRASPASATQAGKRFTEPEKLSRFARFSQVVKGAYLPAPRLKDMERDGLSGEVLFPTVGLALYYGVKDSRLLSALCATYNDWLADYCSYAPSKLKGVGMINVDDVDDGVKELKRIKKLGYTGVLIPVSPHSKKPYDKPDYEALWANAEDLGISLNLHIGTNRLDPAIEPFFRKDAAFFSCVDYWVRSSLASMVFAGVFERYPKLKVGSVEQELGWIPHFLERMDYSYTQRVRSLAPYRFKGKKLPSDFFHQNIFCGFQDDVLGVRDRHLIGVENLMWGSDYPHAESTYPRSQQVLNAMFKGVPKAERAKITAENAAKLYQFN